MVRCVIKLAYKTYGNKKSKAIIWLHGFLGSGDDWNDIISSFNDYYNITIDLPGHGQSHFDNADDYSFESTSKNIINILKNENLDKANVVGYSMGGRLAYHLAVNYSEYFIRVIIESATPGLKTEDERNERILKDRFLSNRLKMEPFDQFLLDWHQLPLFKTLDNNSESYKKMIERRMKNDPSMLALSLEYSGTGAMDSLWDKLSTVKLKLFLIAGSIDSKFVDISSEISALCQSAEMIIVEDCGHNVHVENTEKFIKIVKSCLNK